MKRLEILFKSIFGLDPTLIDASNRTARLSAFVEGGQEELSCQLRPHGAIHCDDGNFYKKEPITEGRRNAHRGLGRRWYDNISGKTGR